MRCELFKRLPEAELKGLALNYKPVVEAILRDADPERYVCLKQEEHLELVTRTLALTSLGEPQKPFRVKCGDKGFWVNPSLLAMQSPKLAAELHGVKESVLIDFPWKAWSFAFFL